MTRAGLISPCRHKMQPGFGTGEGLTFDNAARLFSENDNIISKELAGSLMRQTN